MIYRLEGPFLVFCIDKGKKLAERRILKRMTPICFTLSLEKSTEEYCCLLVGPKCFLTFFALCTWLDLLVIIFKIFAVSLLWLLWLLLTLLLYHLNNQL